MTQQQPTLFKRAYVRGINDELVRLGAARYPSKYAADMIADAVGDQMAPEPATEEGVSPDTAAEVAATLVESAQALMAEAGPAPAMEGEAAPIAPPEEALKTSAAEDLDSRAIKQAEAVMLKAADEGKGSTIGGGDKGNTLAESPVGETKLEAAQRPSGVHNLGVGNTEHPVGEGAVGSEQVPAPKAPSEDGTGAASNSIIEQSEKGGSLLDHIIHKVAMGTTIAGGDKGNTMSQAAAVTGEAALEAARRPEGYATDSRGETALPVTPAATVGTEQPHPDMPGEQGTGAASNSVQEHTDKAAFVQLFKNTAEKTARYLPSGLSEDTKVAHVRRMMGMTTRERNEYLGGLHQTAGTDTKIAVQLIHAHTKAAGEMPPELAAAMVGAEKECKEEKKEECKEEKKEKKEEEKEGSFDILSRVREINASL